MVDDGLATGSTMIAALHALRSRKPARLICAVPVAPPDVLDKIGAYADEVVCLHTPADFQAVGQFYRHFDQVEDEEVIAVLRRGQGARAAPPPPGALLKNGMVRMQLADVTLEGELHPGDGQRLVVFAHGSGSSRHSPRNRYVAQVLNESGIGTLLFDMLTVQEDQDHERRFDIDLLTQRLLGVTDWLRAQAPALSLGYFGASTGAAAALQAAVALRPPVDAVVSRGGRPDLAGAQALQRVTCPTLLIVGSLDTRGAGAQPEGAGADRACGQAGADPGCHAPVRGARYAGAGRDGRRALVRAASARGSIDRRPLGCSAGPAPCFNFPAGPGHRMGTIAIRLAECGVR